MKKRYECCRNCANSDSLTTDHIDCDYFYCNGKEFKSWDDLDREVNILNTYVDDRRYEVGDEVVAIDDYRMDKIIIYGMGTYVKNDGVFDIVNIDGVNVACSMVCKVEYWQELVDETDAEVKRIAYRPKKS